VYTIFRQTQLSTRWYANLLNVHLNNYDGQTLWPKHVVVEMYV